MDGDMLTQDEAKIERAAFAVGFIIGLYLGYMFVDWYTEADLSNVLWAEETDLSNLCSLWM
jgi:hypothetical protein